MFPSSFSSWHNYNTVQLARKPSWRLVGSEVILGPSPVTGSEKSHMTQLRQMRLQKISVKIYLLLRKVVSLCLLDIVFLGMGFLKLLQPTFSQSGNLTNTGRLKKKKKRLWWHCWVIHFYKPKVCYTLNFQLCENIFFFLLFLPLWIVIGIRRFLVGTSRKNKMVKIKYSRKKSFWLTENQPENQNN